MAYDRYDTREGPRGERWRDERHGRDYRGRDGDRGFFDRAGDEIASWFGDDEAERRRREDQRMESRGDWRRDEDRGRFFGRGDFDRERDFRRERAQVGRDEGRGNFPSRASYRGYGGGEGMSRGSTWGTEAGEPGVERGYRPMFGGYTRGEGFFSAAGYPREGRSRDWERGDVG